MAAPKANSTTFTVKVEQERDYGAIRLRLAYAETFDSDAGHTTLTAYAKCNEQLAVMFADYEAIFLPALKQTEYKNTVENKTEKSGTWVDATEFAHEQKNGKDYYNVKAGRYQKFGVACWPECEGRDKAIEQLGNKWKMDVKWKVKIDETGTYPKCLAIEFLPF